MNEREQKLADLLSGGDLRSTGAADQAAKQLLTGRWTTANFLKLIEDAPPVVRMRAADALEKATRSSPELLSGTGKRLLALLTAEQPKEVKWHLLQMAPRHEWTKDCRQILLLVLERSFADTSAIVRTSALQALAELSSQSRDFETAFRRQLMNAKMSKLPSLRARARKLAKRGSLSHKAISARVSSSDKYLP